MLKVVHTNDYGSYSLSNAAMALYNKKRQQHNLDPIAHHRKIVRHDPLLVEVVEELGHNANEDTPLRISKIPDIFKDCYEIFEYDGWETVLCEPQNLIKHRVKDLKVDQLSDTECRNLMAEMVQIANTIYKVESTA